MKLPSGMQDHVRFLYDKLNTIFPVSDDMKSIDAREAFLLKVEKEMAELLLPTEKEIQARKEFEKRVVEAGIQDAIK